MSKVESPLNILVLGATSAIAQATIRIYAARHASFYLVARNPEKLAAAAADAQVRGASKVHTQAFDLDDIGRHAALLAEVRQQFAHIDIALLAHGVLGDQAEAERDFTVTEAILHTNFLSVVSLATHLANEFEQQKKGTLAVISSVAGDRGRKSNYVYGTSKAAVTVFLQGLRNRLDRQGVQVLTIKPGFVATPMTAHLKQGLLFASPHKIASGIAAAIEHRKDVVYLPWFWRPIMLIIRSVPERIFKRLNL
jgi:decaprenylphospho-beta-D-erythro-pentofuranosid-2-ulose 2-reductase